MGLTRELLITAFLPESEYVQRGLARIDVVGIILLVVGLTSLQLFVERGERMEWFASAFIVVMAGVAVFTLTALVLWELRTEEPVVNFRVLKNIPFASGSTLGFVFGMTSFASIFILPLFLQQVRGYSVMDSGLIQMPRMLVMMIIAPIAGRLFGKLDSRLLILVGISLMMLGYFHMAGFTLEVGYWDIFPGMVLTGTGMAFTFSIMSATCMRTIPPALLTAASGLYTLSRRIGGNIGYAFVATQIPHRVTLHRGHLAEHLTPYDGGTMNAIDRLTGFLANSGLPPGEAEQRALKLLDSNVYRQATMMAFNDMFWIMGGLFVLGLPLLFLVGSSVQRRRSGKDVATGATSSGTEKVRQVS